MIKVIVIDDQPLEGKMIEFTLSRFCAYAEYGGQAFNARDGVALAERTQPDIVFLDITMPGADGISIIGDLRRACSKVRIVMLTAHDDFDYIRQAMRAGANDYLLKPTRPRDVTEAVERWADLPGKREDDPIVLAKNYVEEHLDQNITLAMVAEKLYLSPTYFSRLFKQRTNYTFSAWLAEQRILRAQRYLDETNLTIADIATQVGYQESNSFTRLFKQTTGISPTEYRKICKKNTTP